MEGKQEGLRRGRTEAEGLRSVRGREYQGSKGEGEEGGGVEAGGPEEEEEPLDPEEGTYGVPGAGSAGTLVRGGGGRKACGGPGGATGTTEEQGLDG